MKREPESLKAQSRIPQQSVPMHPHATLWEQPHHLDNPETLIG
jgi:hypothetical protein